MGSEAAEPAKQLLPYLQRADELQKHEPLVAYYCRLHAMERGLKIPQKERTKTTNAILVSLMKQLEKDKKSLKLSPDDYLYVEGFASKIFAKADKQDRAGQANLETAKTFYAASIFFDILNQFGEVPPDVEQKQKYAIWKAADIRKAIKEGRKPEPGPPGGEKDQLQSDYPSSSTSIHDPVQSERFSTSQPDDNLPSPYQPQNLGRSESFSHGSPADDALPENNEKPNLHNSGHLPTTHSFSRTDYPGNEFYLPPPSGRPEYPSYGQQYDHQNFQNDLQPVSHNYLPPENPSSSYTYPNFQSYPSFNDSVFPAAPAAPGHQPTYYHAPETTYSNQSAPTLNYTPTVQYGSSDGNHAPPAASPSDNYKYDSNYQPPVEKIAEALKGARFAVSALAFDDVASAVDFLRKSLELLTNPSAESH